MALCKYSLKDKMLIGKYKHHTIQDAIDINPSYVDWLRVHAKNNFEIDEIAEAYLDVYKRQHSTWYSTTVLLILGLFSFTKP